MSKMSRNKQAFCYAVEKDQPQRRPRRVGIDNMTGGFFEVGMAVFLFLKGKLETTSFELDTNVDWAGAFDDLVFKYTDKYTNQEKLCFLQLKHKETQSIKQNVLCSDSGDFSLLKYYDSYCEIHRELQNWHHELSFSSCEFIVYTNASSSLNSYMKEDINSSVSKLINSGGPNAEIICFRKESVDNKVFQKLMPYKKQLEEISNGNFSNEVITEKLQKFKKLDHCKRILRLLAEKQDFYELLNKQLCQDLQENFWEKFLEKIKIYTHQESEEGMDEVSKILLKQLLGTDKYFMNLKDRFLQWRRREDYAITDKCAPFWDSIMEGHLTDLVASVSKRLSYVAEMRFVNVLNLTQRMTHITTQGMTQLSCVKVQQTLQDEGYVLVDNITLQDRLSEVLSIWQYSDWCTYLVVDGGVPHVEISQKFLDIIGLYSGKKLILIEEATSKTTEELCLLLQALHCNDNFSWNQLDSASQEMILESEVMFQGNLVKLRSMCDDKKTLQEILTADIVVKLLHNDYIHVGNCLTHQVDYYITRQFFRHNHITRDIFYKEKCDRLAVSGISGVELQALLPHDETVQEMLSYNRIVDSNCYYFVITNETDFIELCQNFSNSSVHWIECIGSDSFRWYRSRGNMKLIGNHLQKDKGWCGNIENIMQDSQRVVLVIAQPGMGKSTEITQVSTALKEKNKVTWVVRVNLSEITDCLSKYQRGEYTQLLLRYGKFQKEGAEISNFEISLFSYQLKHMGNVVIMFDGFDEISPFYGDTVKSMIFELLKTKCRNIWVTSRPVMRESLVNSFSMLPFEFVPFTIDNQKDFLSEFWGSLEIGKHKDLKFFISRLLARMGENVKDNLREFTGIPLQTKMLAEAFESEALHYDNTGEVMLPVNLDLLGLYQKFVDSKWDIHYKKLNKKQTDMDVLEKEPDEKAKFKEGHMLCALSSLLGSNEIALLHNKANIENGYNNFINKFIPGFERTGIISHLESNRAVFVHRTYAEYFAALWFSKNFSSNSKYFREKYIDKSFEIVRKFFDRILCQHCKLHNAVLNQDFIKIPHLLENDKTCINEQDSGGRTPLHLAVCSYLDEEEPIEDKDIVVPVHNSSCDKILTILFECGASQSIKDKVLSWRPLRFAEFLRAWSAVGLLLQKQGNTKDLVLVRQDIHRIVQKENILEVVQNHGIVDGFISLVKCGQRVERCMGEFAEDASVEACERGFINLVSFFLKCGIPVNYQLTEFRSTMLHIAVRHNQIELATFLVNHGADIEACDVDGSTTLMWATQAGLIDSAYFLIQQGADLNARDQFGYTPFLSAAAEGNLELSKLLVDKGANVEDRNNNSETALHLAAQSASIACLSFLLDARIDLESQCKEGKTALLAASAPGKLASVQFLYNCGASLDIKDNYGNTPLHNCGIALTKWFLQKGLSIETCNNEGETPLHIACGSDTFQVVKCLHEHGASLEVVNNKGNTPLHLAASCGSLTITQYLVKNGVQLEKLNINGHTPLHIASSKGRLEVVKFLRVHEANLLACDNNGNTPLHLAAGYGHLKVVEFLVDCGIDVQACNTQGSTALHFAALAGHLQVVEFLLQYGACIETCNNKGNTALCLAVEKNHTKVVDFLKRYNENPVIA